MQPNPKTFLTCQPNNNPCRLKLLKIYYNYTIITIIEEKKDKLRDKFMTVEHVNLAIAGTKSTSI